MVFSPFMQPVTADEQYAQRRGAVDDRLEPEAQVAAAGQEIGKTGGKCGNQHAHGGATRMARVLTMVPVSMLSTSFLNEVPDHGAAQQQPGGSGDPGIAGRDAPPARGRGLGTFGASGARVGSSELNTTRRCSMPRLRSSLRITRAQGAAVGLGNIRQLQ